MPSTFKLTPLDPPSATPEQIAESIKHLIELNGLDQSKANAMWFGYASRLYAEREFARRRLDVLQLSADLPSNN